MAANAVAVPGLGKAGSTGALQKLKGAPVIFALVVVITLVAAYFLVFSPQNTKISEAEQAAQAAETTRAQLTAELQRLQTLRANAPALREQARKFDEALPSELKLAEFILLVNDAAVKSGIDWVTTNPVAPVPAVGGPAGVLEIAVAMSAEGGYFQMQTFLSSLEELARAMKIGSVDVTTKSGAEDTKSDLTVTLTSKIFMSAPVAAPATPAAPGTAQAGPQAGPAPSAASQSTPASPVSPAGPVGAPGA